ncbi:hypothetical protein AB0N09_43325 [Streptomyces erythrochromogenes]|uniref:hypothetical protein n=1 Tax=Streptomyces erythrochromogenes TaxID=285574 RepID=UPI00343C4944
MALVDGVDTDGIHVIIVTGNHLTAYFPHENGPLIYVEDGHLTATGQARIEAAGNTLIIAKDQAEISLRGQAWAIAQDHTTVHAFDTTHVTARDDTTVWAYGEANIIATDATTITSDSTTVRIWATPTVHRDTHPGTTCITDTDPTQYDDDQLEDAWNTHPHQ